MISRYGVIQLKRLETGAQDWCLVEISEPGTFSDLSPFSSSSEIRIFSDL